jgi:hypothetical protein
VTGTAAPGTVLEATPEGLVVACGAGAVRLLGLCDSAGAVCPGSITARHLPSPDTEEAARLTAALTRVAGAEGAARAGLLALDPIPMGGPAGVPDWRAIPLALPVGMHRDRALRGLALGLARVAARDGGDVAYSPGPSDAPGIVTNWLPLRVPAAGTLAEAEAAFAPALIAARRAGGFACDLMLRDARLAGVFEAQAMLHDALPPIRPPWRLVFATWHDRRT